MTRAHLLKKITLRVERRTPSHWLFSMFINPVCYIYPDVSDRNEVDLKFCDNLK